MSLYSDLNEVLTPYAQKIKDKADKSTTYTKTEVDDLISGVDVETDTTLIVPGAPADAAETGRQIGLLKADLADVPNSTVKSAEQLISDKRTTDKVPYKYRASQSGKSDRAYDMIVGGTVCFNQLVRNGDFSDGTTGFSGNNGSVSASNGVLTFTASSGSGGKNFVAGTNATALDAIVGHKYFYSFYAKVSTADIGGTFTFAPLANNGNISKALTANTDTKITGIRACTKEGKTRIFIYPWGIGATVTDGTETCSVHDFMLIDITAMFGTTIADHIYSLEQSQAGAGVALFKQLFPNDYYLYNAGSLVSVEGLSAHVMRDGDDNIIGSYPLDSTLALHGVPVLNDDGKIEFDGDTYEADGTVTRKYGIVDLGTLTWTYVDAGFRTNVFTSAKYKGRIICDKYMPEENPGKSISLWNDKNIGVGNSATVPFIFVTDSNYYDATAFKTAVSGVMLVYELSAPTTETATPYTSPQVVSPYGTEEYVSTSICPVGHITEYPDNLRAKIDGLPWDLNEVLTPYSQRLNELSEANDEIKADLGDLTELETETKTDLVSAINEAAQSGGGGAVVITNSSEMENTSQIYLYEGTESGYAAGHFYYYNGSVWIDGGLYYVGKDGNNGVDGADGQDGQDGFSPIATVEATSTGVRISITDETGTTSATVQNGTATDAQVAAWLEAHPEATTTVQDGAISKSKLASDVSDVLESLEDARADLGAEHIYEGTSSNNVDIVVNQKLGASGFVTGEMYNIATGETVENAQYNRTTLIRVKPGSKFKSASKNNVKNVVYFDRYMSFVSGFNFTNQDEYTVPENVWYIGFSGNTTFLESSTYYSRALINYWVEGFYIRSSLHTQTDDNLNTPGIAADSFAVGYKKLDKKFVYDAVSSDNVDLRFIKLQSITDDSVYFNKIRDKKTGEIIDGVGTVLKQIFPVKPGTYILLENKHPNIYMYDFDVNYCGYQNKTGEFIIPENVHYVSFTVENRESFAQYEKECYVGARTNFLVSKVNLHYDELSVDLTEANKIDVAQYFISNQTEFERKLRYEMIKAVNRMRQCLRIATFNTYGTGGKGQTNWDGLKELFQREGVEIVGMQEVQDPLGETEGHKVLSVEMESWHLKTFSNVASFPTNARVLATTGDFEIVSSTEVGYSVQSGYGNRYFVRSEVQLPLLNNKKWSDHLKMSVYNTQLEVSKTTGPRQAAELIAAVQNDKNPFIVVLGDFNDESMFSKPVFDVFTNAGLTPVIADYFSTSTETDGRSLVDNIFVSSRIHPVGYNVIYSGDVKWPQGGVLSNISDHDMVIGDLQLDYSDIIAVKPILTNCSLSGIDNWFSRNDEPITITVVPDDGYTISSIEVGDGEWLSTNANYPDGVVVINGDTITIDPSGVCTDMYIRATATAS